MNKEMIIDKLVDQNDPMSYIELESVIRETVERLSFPDMVKVIATELSCVDTRENMLNTIATVISSHGYGRKYIDKLIQIEGLDPCIMVMLDQKIVDYMKLREEFAATFGGAEAVEKYEVVGVDEDEISEFTIPHFKTEKIKIGYDIAEYFLIPTTPYDRIAENWRNVNGVAEHLSILDRTAQENYRDPVLIPKVQLVCSQVATGLTAAVCLSTLLDLDMDRSIHDLDKRVLVGNKVFIVDATEVDQCLERVGTYNPEPFKQATNIVTCYLENRTQLNLVIIVRKEMILSQDFADKLKEFSAYQNSVIIITEDSSGLSEVIEDIDFVGGYESYKIDEPEFDSEYNKALLVRALDWSDGCKNIGIAEDVDLSRVLLRMSEIRLWEGEKTIQAMGEKMLRRVFRKDIVNNEDFQWLYSDMFQPKEKSSE
ncbi:MAG TPA: hypothetical protein DEP72_01445 [Clostridiales bacterium]|nr:MAG: hypothetical protein A2Y18_05180 [Clostridiales bacterium GWD2_32_19]HCC06818.1 hypothetical protein [Clostridiales bacterium]